MLALNSGHTVGDVSAPDLIWRTNIELSVQVIRDIWPFMSSLLIFVCAGLFTGKPGLLHQPPNFKSADTIAFITHHHHK